MFGLFSTGYIFIAGDENSLIWVIIKDLLRTYKLDFIRFDVNNKLEK